MVPTHCVLGSPVRIGFLCVLVLFRRLLPIRTPAIFAKLNERVCVWGGDTLRVWFVKYSSSYTPLVKALAGLSSRVKSVKRFKHTLISPVAGKGRP